jgi:hypothetical protein
VNFTYSLNYLIDMENAVIVDVEAPPTHIPKEVAATGSMVERVQVRFGLKPRHIAGDTAYGTGGMLGWLRERDIEPHIPVWDKANRVDGTFSRDDFIFHKDRNVYTCPGGKVLKTTGRVHDGKALQTTPTNACSAASADTDCVKKRDPRRDDTIRTEHTKNTELDSNARLKKRTLASSLLLVFRRPYPRQFFSFGNLGGGHAFGKFIPVI